MTEREISELVGYAYPAAVSVDGRPGWFRRSWVIRTAREIDEAMCASLGEIITRNVSAALLNSGVPAETLARGAPTVVVSALDARHAIVRTEILGPYSDLNVGDAPMVATWGALQQVDAQLGIEELEGLPRRFWWPLGGARGG